MTNKIDGLMPGAPKGVAGAESPGRRRVADDRPVDPSTSSDTVKLTGHAEQLQEIERQLASQPSYDGQKVQDVRNALEQGTYRMDPAAIAAKLLQFERSIAKA